MRWSQRALLPLDVDDAALCAVLESLLPTFAVHLDSAIWRGLRVSEPDDADVVRSRLSHPAKIEDERSNRLYALSAHLFDRDGVETKPHDHRYPLAVFPFALDDDDASPLYEMMWRNSTTGHEQRVHVGPGDMWAIAKPTEIRHTVKSLRPHGSVLIADVTDPPTRPDRMSQTPLQPKDITRVRTTLAVALRRTLECGVDTSLDDPTPIPD